MSRWTLCPVPGFGVAVGELISPLAVSADVTDPTYRLAERTDETVTLFVLMGAPETMPATEFDARTWLTWVPTGLAESFEAAMREVEPA